MKLTKQKHLISDCHNKPCYVVDDSKTYCFECLKKCTSRQECDYCRKNNVLCNVTEWKEYGLIARIDFDLRRNA